MAEPGQRLLARIVDTLVVGLPVVVVVREVVPRTDVDVAAPPAVAAFLLLYEWIQLALWGRTLGKRFAGIQVVREDIGAAPEDIEASTEVDPGAEPGLRRRDRLGTARSLLRTALYALPIGVRPVPVLGLIAGLFWVGNAALMYEGGARRALHDRLAGTAVVKRGAR
ncbi:RDD family protein [Spirillospora sp. NPDC029432]|uniref:RDD family protein n=1 Tax=Spirillospora sp. NPDC029432 TaxID=3154599 RepID=UPI003456709C